MSKFSEMCAAFAKGQKARDEYEQRCWKNLGQLVQGFSTYCKFPPGNIRIVPLDKEPEPNTNYSPHKAAQFDTTDGFWRLGMAVTLPETPNTTYPCVYFVIKLAVAERNGKVVAKVGEKGSQYEQEIDLEDEGQCKAFYDGIVERINLALLTGQHATDPKTMGFKVTKAGKIGA